MIDSTQIPNTLAQPFDLVKSPVINPMQPVQAAPAIPIQVTPQVPQKNPLAGNQAVPGSFASKLGKALDDTPLALAPDGKPEPGSWARSLVGAAQKVLSGAQDISTTPATATSGFGGFVEGFSQTAANEAARQQKEAALAAQQKQQDVENQREDKKLDLDQQRQNDLHAYTQMQTVALQKTADKLDDEQADRYNADGKAAIEMYVKGNHQLIGSFVPESEARGEMKSGGKFDLDEVIAFPVGSKITFTPDGKKIKETLWSSVSKKGDVEVDDANAKLLRDYGQTNFPVGSKPDGVILNQALTSAQAARTSSDLLNKMHDEMDLEHLDSQYIREHSADLSKMAPVFGVSGDDPITTLQKVSKLTGPDGKPTELAQSAARLLIPRYNKDGKLIGGYSQDDLEKHRHNVQQEAIDRQEAALKKAEKSKYPGDTTLINGPLDQSGPLKGLNSAYIKSLPADDRPIIIAASQGRLSIDRLPYLISRNPEFVNAWVAADPNVDFNNVTGFPSLYKDFTSGDTSVGLTSSGAAARHMRELYDLTTTASMIPGTEAYDKRVAAISQVAPELAKAFKGGKGSAAVEDTREQKEALLGINPFNRKSILKVKAGLLAEKLEENQQKWDNGMPSPLYKVPMPGISKEAQDALFYIVNDGKTKEQITHGQTNQVPTGADKEVTVNGKVVGHMIGNKYVPMQ